MARRSNRPVSTMFAAAQTSQLETQIVQKDEEIQDLKRQLETLAQTPYSASTVQKYPATDFVPLRLPDGLTQPRKYFDRSALDNLKASIQKVGIQEPLLARPAPDGKLEIISGERRWRSATELQLDQVPALVKDFSDEEALEIALVANLMREDLNLVEESDSIVALIALRLKLSRDQLPPLLFKIKNLRSRYRYSNQEIADEMAQSDIENSGILSEKAIADIDAIFAEFGMTLESFTANRLTALQRMPSALLEAVRYGQIGFSKADAIRKAHLDEPITNQLLQEAVAADLTKQEIRARIQKLKSQSASAENVEIHAAVAEKPIRDRIHAHYLKMRKNPQVWSTPKLQKQLRQMERLLQSISETAAHL
ncbi:MAG: ParB/RepB/Spo0J family partition protein [Leptolyngbya sp. SIO4C5]|nr:ParB/RepB/Spo0J family partition protein [Leptolyngbya sp. SIO4C5]